MILTLEPILDVHYVLEGVVRTAGRQVRIAAPGEGHSPLCADVEQLRDQPDYWDRLVS